MSKYDLLEGLEKADVAGELVWIDENSYSIGQYCNCELCGKCVILPWKPNFTAHCDSCSTCGKNGNAIWSHKSNWGDHNNV